MKEKYRPYLIEMNGVACSVDGPTKIPVEMIPMWNKTVAALDVQDIYRVRVGQRTPLLFYDIEEDSVWTRHRHLRVGYTNASKIRIIWKTANGRVFLAYRKKESNLYRFRRVK